MIVLTESSTPVQFNITSSTGYSYIGTTTANAATFITIPSSLQVRQSSYTYRHLGLHVTSSPTQPISVVVIGYTTTPRSTYLALPCHDQPTKEYVYYGISHESSESNRYSQILIVGCRDNTTVTITPTQMIQLPQDPQQSNSPIVTIIAGTSHTVIIHTLQTMLIAAEFVDLTGTKVVSNHPLTVIGGHDCTTVPVSYLDCDPIATQSPPTINWGTQFLLIPLQSRNNGQMVKVLSSENGTNVVIRCSEQSLHSNLAFAGNVISYYIGSLHYCHIQCSQPCYVAEFAFGHEYNSYIWDGYGDPLIMTVPSLRQYIHSVTFTTLLEMPTNFFGIVVPADSYFNGTVLINDVLTTYDWTLIYNVNGTISGYGYTTTANGNYTISHSHPNGNIYVSVYGFSHYGGYGYPAGMLLDILAVSKNSTQHVNSSFIFSNIYQTNCLSMAPSTTIIMITTTSQMTPTVIYDITSITTPIQSTITLKDTCTEAITTTTVTASIVGSPLSCDYSTVLAQATTITFYSEPLSLTNEPVTTPMCPSTALYTITTCVTSSISPAITTKDLANRQPSITRATVIITGKGILITTNNIIILRPTNDLKTEKASSTINIVSNIGLAIALLLSIIVCSVVSILSYKVGVSRGRKQATDGCESIAFTNPHYHAEPDIDPPIVQNLPNPPNHQNFPNPPNAQNRPNPPNAQNRPNPFNVQNRPNPPNAQNLPNPPSYQNRPNPANVQNLPNPPTYENRPNPPNAQNRPNPPCYQNRPRPANVQNLPNPPNAQNRPNPPSYQNRPNPANVQNLPNPPTYENLPNPPNAQNRPNPPSYQNRPNPANVQNLPNPPTYENLPNPPNAQNRPNPPSYQNRPNPANVQNLPNPPTYENRPNPPNAQNQPNPPSYQNLPNPANVQNRPNPPNYQNQPNLPNNQNQPNPPNYQNLCNPINHQNLLNPPNNQIPPTYQNLPNPNNQQSLYTPLVIDTMESPLSIYTTIIQPLSPEWRETSFSSERNQSSLINN